MQARTQTADVLKGIAVLLMIQVHIVELFATEDIYYSSIGKILLFLGGPPVAPMFMILFGYFIYSSQKTTLQLIKRGLGIFALGMLLNLALNFNLIVSVYQQKIKVDVWPYIFGVDIFQFAGLSLIIIAILKNSFQKYTTLIFSLIFICTLLGKILIHHPPSNDILLFSTAFFYGSCNWSYFPLLPWLAYPLAGVALYQMQQHYDFNFIKSIKTKLVGLIIFAAFIVLTIFYAISIASDLQTYYHHGTLFFLWTIAFCAGYGMLIHEITQRIRENIIVNYIKWLGKHVTLIYVIQWIIIGNLATEIYKTVSNPVYLIGCFIGIVILSNALAFLILKLKFYLHNRTLA